MSVLNETCFQVKLFGAEKIERYDCEKIFHENVTTQKQVWKTNVEAVMFSTVLDFSTWALKIPKTFLDQTNKKNCMEGTSPFLLLAIFNDIRYFSGDKHADNKRRAQQREKNKFFLVMSFPWLRVRTRRLLYSFCWGLLKNRRNTEFFIGYVSVYTGCA